MCWTPPDQVCAGSTGVTVFAPEGYCEKGDCIYPTKRTECDSGRCVDGLCEQTPCQGITCNHPDASSCGEAGGVIRYAAEGFCSEGDCFYASREEMCDGSCLNGVCGQYTCHGIYCDKSEARFCKDDQTLQIFAPRGVCSSSSGEADCRYATREVACDDGCLDGACVENTCKGMVCTVPEARYCEGDDLVAWEPRGRCADGECVYEQRLETCEFGCEGGECRENPCIGVTCNNPYAAYCEDDTVLRYFLPDGVCDEGVCVYAAETVVCEHGCLDGQCVGDPCAGVICNLPPATYCEDDAVLTFWDGEPGVCEDGFCVYETASATCGESCVDGRCSDDFCVGVVCDVPGADFCLDDETLYTYTSSEGECADGVCRYAATTETCPGGCKDSACLPEIAMCEENTCNGRGSCDASEGKIVCSCEPGWQGSRCEVDIDECAGGFDGCSETEECVNTEGGYECACADGYVWNGTVCAEEGSACDPNPCLNGGECEEADAGVLCSCPQGFGGDLCETGGLCIDADEDGYGESCDNGEDCDDEDPDRFVSVSAYVDGDLDGLGGDTVETICVGDGLPQGYEAQGGDCNDDNELVWQILTGYRDEDGDGYGAGVLLSVCAGEAVGEGLSTRAGDCDDSSAAISPAASEISCNKIDDDCNTETPDALDEDSDGYSMCAECNDSDSAINPGVDEVLCNDINDDCNAATSDTPDGDSDGYTVCDDCDDSNGAANPGEAETLCNGVDDDCDESTSDLPDFDSSTEHCGGCGNRCDSVGSLWPQGRVPQNVADFDCLAGTCVIEECDDGYRNDPDNSYDDCDIDLSTVPVSIDIGTSAWRAADVGTTRRGLDLSDAETVQLDAQCTSSLGNTWDCTDAATWSASSTETLSVNGGSVSVLAAGVAAVSAELTGVSSAYIYIQAADYTAWLDIDEPSGVGDYELVSALDPCSGDTPIGIECRTVSDLPWVVTGETVACVAETGLSCVNESQESDAGCSDYMVRFICP